MAGALALLMHVGREQQLFLESDEPIIRAVRSAEAGLKRSGAMREISEG
jgi:hypothetical protein